MYKQIGMIVLLALGFTLAGCGSSSMGSNSGNINGTWTAALTNPDGSPAFSFSTTFTQGSSSTLSVTDFTFTSTGSCFASEQTSQTGSFSLSGNFSGNVAGTFGMMITTMSTGTKNVLTLQGSVAGNTISGTWTLTGATGCSGNGSFTINRM